MKQFLSLLTLALLLCLGTFASAQIPSYVPNNGLVGWWPFNGNANDESGNGNHGTVNGATLAADRFGNAGKAYSFDGVNDWINVQSGGLTNSNVPNSFSISIWINSINGTGPIVSKRHSLFENWQTLTMDRNNTILWLTDAHNYFVNPINKTITLNNWQHIYVEKNGNQYKLFINGNQEISYQDNFVFSNNFSDMIFGYQGAWGTFFNGILDDIAIYNRALTPAEVQQLYLGNCTPTFTAQPQNKSVGQGQTTTFAVQVDTTSTFQWQMDNGFGFVNLVNSSLFSGVTTNTLTVKGSNSVDGYSFRCIATACQSDTSNAATLTVTSNSSTLGSVAGVPGKINYQGAAVDSLGKPMKNQTISLKLSVLDSSSSGAAAYVETHSTPTNGSGIFSLQIGGGTAVTGMFDSIPWANGRNKYLKTEVQQNGTWVNLGTSQLVSVPYALHAGSAEVSRKSYELMDSAGNAYQIKIVNGQPTLVSAPGNVSSPGTFACGQFVTFAGESYPTVQIGTQCWFQKNVNAGTMVLGANDQTNNSILEKYCYNNDTANCSIYGGLYQWAEAVQYQNGASNTASPSPAFGGNIKGICPTGWHLPSDGEFCTLTTFLDATVNCGAFTWSGTDAGGKIKSASGLWSSPNTGATNSSGFSALPGGVRDPNGTFIFIGNSTLFWSSSESSSANALYRDLSHINSFIARNFANKGHGFSIRCLKD